MLKMSTDYWKLEKDLCRCCHSEGSFKNLADSCCMDVQTEDTYSDMLRQSLDINVSIQLSIFIALVLQI